MTLKIGFLTTLGYNVGDEFIREGVRAALDATGVRYAPLYVHKLDEASLREPREDETRIVADKYWDADVFVQSGAPVYWHNGGGRQKSTNAPWHRWMWEERILDGRGRRGPVFVNLGAGSGQAWGDDGASFLDDPECVAFARAAGERAAVTTVRDPLAAAMLAKLGVRFEAMPCPAFLAAARHPAGVPQSDLIGVNLMPRGGHYESDPAFEPSVWTLRCSRMADLLRRMGRLVFICHDEAEARFARTIAAPDERVFVAAGWRPYLDVYSACATVVSCRVHGAVCAAGFGVPGVILGKDTRARIGEYMGLEIMRAATAEPEEIAHAAEQLLERRTAESCRLLELRDCTLAAYRDLLRPVLEGIEPKRSASPARSGRGAIARLASTAELNSAEFTGFMASANAFAQRHGLQRFTNWSKVWEYPWLWRHGLKEMNWRGASLVDLGSELSPIPWLLAMLGAKVTIIETAKGAFVEKWRALRETLNVDVRWELVDSERIPLPDASVDALTSFSVIEHQPDKLAAINEAVRVLKPGGLLALSFDICEPEMGMAFPEWNGRALTMREFEETIWLHPAFGQRERPAWNIDDIGPYLEWHKQSAPHHTYATGAAVLRKVG